MLEVGDRVKLLCSPRSETAVFIGWRGTVKKIGLDELYEIVFESPDPKSKAKICILCIEDMVELLQLKSL